ncbi:haloacid dehalogenase-like hydrolase domain-containing protein Sgpp isoform X2 [Cucumis sativus]|uniref:haloacid dehalogenase-like hydrolase domain-containing protein Sgpp isoform X2 n=1 Tax=Cucumis sativus TaxID=3659 RepID=UPI0012F49CDC|nr:haloacid dehalogenase-like hydrolase domain-containing protein Sgpp isoform X2 [Cucumis sativus]
MTVSKDENSLHRLGRIAPVEAVLFDVDGTLCDSDPLHFYAFREMLQKIGFNGGIPIDEEFYIKNIAGKNNDGIIRTLFPNDVEQGAEYMNEKEAMFRRLVVEQLKPVSGLYKVKKWVEDHRLKCAAVTNSSRINAELMISMLGLTDFFETIIIGDECEHPKPHPEPYLKALEALQVSKDHTFIFEDSLTGIKAGVEADMPVVGISMRNSEQLLMQAKPALLVKDYNDLKLWLALDELVVRGDTIANA